MQWKRSTKNYENRQCPNLLKQCWQNGFNVNSQWANCEKNLTTGFNEQKPFFKLCCCHGSSTHLSQNARIKSSMVNLYSCKKRAPTNKWLESNGELGIGSWKLCSATLNQSARVFALSYFLNNNDSRMTDYPFPDQNGRLNLWPISDENTLNWNHQYMTYITM